MKHSDYSLLPKGKTFAYGQAKLHYRVWQGGPDYLLAFHGFGQKSDEFAVLAKALAPNFSLIGIDLFYHGNSHWPEAEQPLTQAYWQQLLGAFLESLNIDRFSLAGFSLGGKLVLASLHAFPERVNHIYFIAPDGIKTSFWYSLATYPHWARRYFRRLVDQPEQFFKLASILRKLSLVDKGIVRFASSQMNTHDKRQRVYNSWIVYSKLRFSMAQTASLIRRHNIQLSMFLGKYDRIMTLENMTRLLRHLDDYSLEVLESGHKTLIEDTARYIHENSAGPR